MLCTTPCAHLLPHESHAPHGLDSAAMLHKKNAVARSQVGNGGSHMTLRTEPRPRGIEPASSLHRACIERPA